MITQTVPNSHRVTVESSLYSKGPGYVVIAIAWSQDQTARVDERWVRYETEAEADAAAIKLQDADWATVGKWYAHA